MNTYKGITFDEKGLNQEDIFLVTSKKPPKIFLNEEEAQEFHKKMAFSKLIKKSRGSVKKENLIQFFFNGELWEK